MAVHRDTPTCQFCEKPIAKAVYKDYSDLPQAMKPYGDSFERWDYWDCSCDEAVKYRQQPKKEFPKKK